MNDTTTEESTRTGQDEEDGKPKIKGGVADYLSAPKKKRKSYVVLAIGKGVAGDVSQSINQFVKAQYKTMAISLPRNEEELLKQSSRNIQLLIIDDEFLESEKTIAVVKQLKTKRNDGPIPCLFLTRNASQLISLYNRELIAFQESDDYLAHTGEPLPYILSRVKASIEGGARRRSRRYKIDIPLRFFSLTPNKLLDGQLLDLSIHGAMIKMREADIFKAGDQIKLNLPIGELLSFQYGDFLSISAKVKRVMIGGDRAGVSFEYVTERQLTILTRYLTELVALQLTNRSIPHQRKITFDNGL